MKPTIPSLFTVLISFACPITANSADWTAGPFDMPESAIFDAQNERIVVSVMVGHPGEADENGLLALVSPEGEVLDPNWVTGLDAPKGMAIVGDTLLVADLTRLHEIDRHSGTLLRSVEVDGAVFLNDVTSDGTQAFVSDLFANRILRYAGGDISIWLEEEKLAHPNGLLLDGTQLVVGSWGQGIRDDFSTEVPGSLLTIDLESRKIDTLVHELGNLDGVVRVNERLLVNDWITGQIFAVRTDGTHEIVAQYPAGLADIAAHGNTLLLPSMLEGRLSSRTFP